MKTTEFKNLAMLLSAGLLCLCARGQIFHVTTTADWGPGSLRDAITSANAAGEGTIVFTNVSGTISLQSALPMIDGNLTILGSGPTNVAIDGNLTNRIFNVTTNVIVNISGLALRRGFAYRTNGSSFPPVVGQSGSAILNAGILSVSNCCISDNGSNPNYGYSSSLAVVSSGESLVLNNVVFSNNFVNGGVAALLASNVRATNCLFITNRSYDFPPIQVSGDSVFSDSVFAGNIAWQAADGGALEATGNLTLLNCDVINNYADHNIGGIYFHGNSLLISNCKIDNNVAYTAYGGIVASGSNIVILNSSISGNHADTFGIGLYGDVSLTGCTISSNITLVSHPGIDTSGTLNLTNCTISGNSSYWDPGSAITLGGAATVQTVNCTVVLNGTGVENFKSTFYALNTLIAKNGRDFSGILTSQGYNLIGNPDTNTVIVGLTDGNIYGVEPLLGPLQNNGGLTLTHALIRGSPAINAGNKDGAPLTDQRGIARPYGQEIDIGAFESEYNVLRFTDISRVNATDIHLQLAGLPGSVCTIQASSNFLDWENVFASDNGTTGILEFVDQDAANHPTRFYRAFIDN